MYYRLLKSVKDRLITEFKDTMSKHPKYVEMIPHIQGKYAFEGRPQRGIVVSNGSVTPLKLSNDNFMGTVMSHSMLTSTPGFPSTSVEWIRDDLAAIRNNSDVFPTLPGVYIIDITGSYSERSGTFTVTPFVHVTKEPIIKFVQGDEGVAALLNTPYEGSVRLVLNDLGHLIEGTEFTIDYDTGEIAFLKDFRPDDFVWAEYIYQGAATGPHVWQQDKMTNTGIPGVILAFGGRVADNDRMAVVITEGIVPTHRAYGGKWEMGYSLEMFARDSIQFEEIVDHILVTLAGPSYAKLHDEGVHVTNFSFGGEAEDVYDEDSDEWIHNGSLSIDIMTNWMIHVPILPLVRSVEDVTAADAAAIAGMNENETTVIQSAIRVLDRLGFNINVDPVMPGRGFLYQKIT